MVAVNVRLVEENFQSYTEGDKPVAVNNISFPTKKDGWNNNNDHNATLSKSTWYLRKGKKKADGDPNAKTWLP